MALIWLLSSTFGAGIGLIVAKYLLNLGFTGTTLMAIAGAVAGNSLFGDDKYGRNATGDKFMGSYDFFGNRRTHF